MSQGKDGVSKGGRRVCRINDLASTKSKPGRVPVSPATWWRWVKDGRAPAPFKLGPNTTVWDLDEVEQWLAQQATGESEQ